MNYESRVVDQHDARPAGADGYIDVETIGRRRRLLWIALAVVAALGLAAWLMNRGGEEEGFNSNRDTTPTVTVVAPGRSTVTGTINATGTLAARHEVAVGVVGEGGRVVAVNVQQGDWVRAGQVLAVIDRSVQSQQAQSSAANIQVAKADAELSQANLDRAMQLVERGFISKADIDRLTATRDAAAARVRVAEAQYRELLARNARLNVVAPVSGLVLDRNVEVGQVLSAGGQNPPFTIAQGGEMELLANLGESDLAQVSVGSLATVTPVGTSKSFTGPIWQMPPTIDPQTRQGAARIALGYDPALRPGGFASAQIGGGAVVAPQLPESAVLNDDKGTYVYIVGKDDKVERRAVTTGTVTAQGIAITSGLTGNERVVLRAGGFVNPGDKVRPSVAKPAE